MSDSDIKRQAIRDKVEQSQAELAQAESAKPGIPRQDPPERLAALVMDYPMALMLGGLAVGVVAGALLPKGVARTLTRKAVAAAALAGDLGLNYGRSTVDAANETVATVGREGRRALDDLSGKLAVVSGSIGENANDAGKRAVAVANDTAEVARDAALRIAQQIVRLTSQLRR